MGRAFRGPPPAVHTGIRRFGAQFPATLASICPSSTGNCCMSSMVKWAAGLAVAVAMKTQHRHSRRARARDPGQAVLDHEASLSRVDFSRAYRSMRCISAGRPRRSHRRHGRWVAARGRSAPARPVRASKSSGSLRPSSASMLRRASRSGMRATGNHLAVDQDAVAIENHEIDRHRCPVSENRCPRLRVARPSAPRTSQDVDRADTDQSVRLLMTYDEVLSSSSGTQYSSSRWSISL